LKATCAAVYEHPAVRWLLGGELHPGGAATTRRHLRAVDPKPGERLLDVACGAGDSALLAAGQLGLSVTGLDYADGVLAEAGNAAEERGLADRAKFVRGDAESLAFDDASFDLALCECSLCLFPDKTRAIEEIRRVLRPGGRLALADVVAKRERLPEQLRGALATVACVGEALSTEELAALLEAHGFSIQVMELRRDDVAAMAARVEDRLRGVRILAAGAFESSLPGGVEEAIELVRLARREIDRWNLGYAIFGAWRG
jgi:arsenite methyltransferase